MSGANAGRTTAGVAGIVSAFALAQIFMCLLSPDTSATSAPQTPPCPGSYQPRGHHHHHHTWRKGIGSSGIGGGGGGGQ